MPKDEKEVKEMDMYTNNSKGMPEERSGSIDSEESSITELAVT